MFSFLQLIRLPNLLIIAFTQYMIRFCLIQPILSRLNLELQMSEIEFFLLVLATVFIAAGGYIINDYFDVRIDRINKPSRLVIDRGMTRRTAILLHTVLSFLGIVTGMFLSWKSHILLTGSALFILSAIGLWFYSTFLKYQFIVGNLVVALLTGLVPFMVALFEVPRLLITYNSQLLAQQLLIEQHQLSGFIPTTSILNWTAVYGAAAFVLSFIREIIKDIEDAEGDMEYGCKTIPVALGIRKTKNILYSLLLLFMAALGFVQYYQYKSSDWLSFLYFLLLLQLPFAVLFFKIARAREKKHFHTGSMIVKVLMLSGICFLFLFRLLLK